MLETTSPNAVLIKNIAGYICFKLFSGDQPLMSIRFLIVFFALLSLSTQHAFSEVNSDNLMSVASKVRSVTGASTDASILVGAFSADGSLANAGSLTSGDYVNLIATIKPDSNDAGSN
ncbi:MAG: hypothetical protein ACKVKR_04810, partial [Pseudomonadales bacterium]